MVWWWSPSLYSTIAIILIVYSKYPIHCSFVADANELLSLAVDSGESSIVHSLLFKKYADPNCKDQHQRSPLHLVKDVEVLRILLQFDANVNAQDAELNTPLINAARLGSVECVKALLCVPNILIDAQNSLGQTALMQAILSKRLAIIYILANYGAMTNLVDREGNTALDYAQKTGCPTIIGIVQSKLVKE